MLGFFVIYTGTSVFMASLVCEDLSGYIVKKMNWMIGMQRDIYSMTKVENIFFYWLLLLHS